MPYYTYAVTTGKLLEISEDLLHDGSPPSGVAVTYIDVPTEELNTQYIWNEEDRDFVPKVV